MGKNHHEAGEFARTASPFLLLFLISSLPPQVLTLVILLMAGRTCASARCFREHELGEAAKRQLQSRYPQPEEPPSSAAADSPYTCPVELYQQQLSPHPRERSLSPWRYV